MNDEPNQEWEDEEKLIDDIVEEGKKLDAFNDEINLFLDGLDAFEDGNYEEALGFFKQLKRDIDKDNYTKAQIYIGLIFSLQKNFEEAEQAYKNVKREDSKENYVEAQANLGRLLENLKRFEEAEQAYKNVKREDSKENYARAQVNLGSLLENLKRFEEAEQAYKNVKREDSKENYARAQLNLGLCLNQFGKNLEAEQAIKRVKRTDNAVIYAWAQLFLYILFGKKIYLKNIQIKDSLHVYSKAQFRLGQQTNKLNIKHNYWKNIPKNSEQYHKESYQIDVVEQIIGLKNSKYKNKLFHIFETVRDILKILFINNKYEQFIAHYTNLTVSKLLLSKKDNEEKFVPLSRLRLNTINLMNDPEEGILINKLLCIDSKIITQDSAFIACFTLHHDSLNQFRLYAKEGQQEASGLSLVLDKDFFAEEHNAARIYKKETLLNKDEVKDEDNTLASMPLYRCIYFDPSSGLIKVAQREKWSFWREFKLEDKCRWYEENKLAENNWKEYIHGKGHQDGIKKIEDSVKKGLEELSKLIAAMNFDEMNSRERELLAEIVLPLRYLMKHMAFKEEQECRIVYVTKMENPLVKYDKEIKRIYIDYKPSVMEHLEKIYLAPKAKDEKTFMEYLCAHGQTVRQHKVTKETNGRVQVKISQNPFR